MRGYSLSQRTAGCLFPVTSGSKRREPVEVTEWQTDDLFLFQFQISPRKKLNESLSCLSTAHRDSCCHGSAPGQTVHHRDRHRARPGQEIRVRPRVRVSREDRERFVTLCQTHNNSTLSCIFFSRIASLTYFPKTAIAPK